MGRLFQRLKDEDGALVTHRGAQAHAMGLVGLLKIESSHRQPGKLFEDLQWEGMKFRTVSELELIVAAVKVLVVPHAESFVAEIFRKSLPETNLLPWEQVIANTKDSGADIIWMSLCLSPSAIKTIYDALLATPPEDWPLVLRPLSAGEIMAACGLFFMDTFFEEKKARRKEVCLQQAGEALYVAGLNRSAEESGGLATEQKRRAGATRDQLLYAPIRAYVIQHYIKRNNWKSTRQASVEIFPLALSFAQANGLYLSPDRAQLTVYEWLLAYCDKSNIAPLI
jgi:hypothetical protein